MLDILWTTLNLMAMMREHRDEIHYYFLSFLEHSD